MGKMMIGLGAIFALLGVAAGAFGAHGLKTRLTPDMLAVFEIAVRYQVYHALGMILVGSIGLSRPDGVWTAAGSAMLAGILVFSGSLYVLSLTGTKWLGAITPLGGLGFRVGWALLAWGAFTKL